MLAQAACFVVLQYMSSGHQDTPVERSCVQYCWEACMLAYLELDEWLLQLPGPGVHHDGPWQTQQTAVLLKVPCGSQHGSLMSQLLSLVHLYTTSCCPALPAGLQQNEAVGRDNLTGLDTHSTPHNRTLQVW